MQRFGVIQGNAYWYVVDLLRGHRVVEVAATKAAARKKAEEMNKLEVME